MAETATVDAPVDTRERRLGVALWGRIARLYGRNLRLAEARVREAGLSVAQFDALATIGAHEGIAQHELAQALLVTQGAVTQVLDKLEARGLLRRCPEGRLNRLTLTEEGQRLRERVVPDQEDFQARQFASLTPAERRELLRLLSKLQRGQRIGQPR